MIPSHLTLLPDFFKKFLIISKIQIVVVCTSVKCLGLLAVGLKREFSQQAKLSYIPLLDKLKVQSDKIFG